MPKNDAHSIIQLGIGAPGPLRLQFPFPVLSQRCPNRKTILRSDKHSLLLFLVFNQSPESDEYIYHTFFQVPWICKLCRCLFILSCCWRYCTRVCSSTVGEPLGLWIVSKDRWAQELLRMLPLLPSHCLFPFDWGFEGHLPEPASRDPCYLRVFSHLQHDLNPCFRLLKQQEHSLGNLCWNPFRSWSYLFPVINCNPPFPLLPQQGSWWFYSGQSVECQWTVGDFKELPTDYVAGCGTKEQDGKYSWSWSELGGTRRNRIAKQNKDLELVLIQEKEFPSVKKNQSIYLIGSFLYTTKKY